MEAKGLINILLAIVILFSALIFIPTSGNAAVNIPDDHDFEFPEPSKDQENS
jgi:hypothetical protein